MFCSVLVQTTEECSGQCPCQGTQEDSSQRRVGITLREDNEVQRLNTAPAYKTGRRDRSEGKYVKAMLKENNLFEGQERTRGIGGDN